MTINERAPGKAELAYEAIREAILSGAWEPGAAIDKTALCEKLGVSRFPVSAALGRLGLERLVRVEPQHGSFVAPISASDVREHLFVRAALESAVAQRAAVELDDDSRADLAANLEEAEAAAAAQDHPLFYNLDVGFHAGLSAPMGLSRTAEILVGVRSHLERVRRLLMTPRGRLPETLTEHRAVLAAVLSGDPEAARAAMADHIAAVSSTFEALARDKPHLFVP